MSAKPPADRTILVVSLAAGLLSALPFAGSIGQDFVQWDDPMNVLDNPHVQGLSLENLKWMATGYLGGHYHPLTWLSFAVDFAIGGLNPAGYHVTNLLLHGATAAALCALIAALVRDVPRAHVAAGAFVGAILWGVHPLRTESVAWVTERRDVLSGLFYVLTALAYVKGRRGWALAWFLLSLLSKAWGITLPFALLLLDYYPLGRIRSARDLGRRALEASPFFLLAAFFAWRAIAAQSEFEALIPLSTLPLGARFAQAAFGLVFYLEKTLVPFNLSPLYERDAALSLAHPLYGSCAAGVVIAGIALFLLRRRAPALPIAAIAYAIALAPVLGFTQAGKQMAADRYSYVAMMPWSLALGGWIARRKLVAPLAAAGALAALLLGIRSADQTKVWASTRGLWEHALKVDPESYFALITVAWEYQRVGRIDEAIAIYQRALTSPELTEEGKMRRNLAFAYVQKNDLPHAIEQWEGLLRTEPDALDLYASIGAAWFKLGNQEKALKFLTEANRRSSDNPGSYLLLADFYYSTRAWSDVIGPASRAAALDPKSAKARTLLGVSLQQLGKLAEAESVLREAAELEPTNAEWQCNLASVLWDRGKSDDAKACVRRALTLDPRNERARSAARAWGVER